MQCLPNTIEPCAAEAWDGRWSFRGTSLFTNNGCPPPQLYSPRWAFHSSWNNNKRSQILPPSKIPMWVPILVYCKFIDVLYLNEMEYYSQLLHDFVWAMWGHFHKIFYYDACPFGQFHGNRRTIQTKCSKFKQVLLEKLSLVTLYNITNASIE